MWQKGELSFMDKDNIATRLGLSDDEDFSPADFTTKDMKRISDRVNRILAGDTADDVPVPPAKEDTVDISRIGADESNGSSDESVDISSFSNEDKQYHAEDLSNGGYVTNISDIEEYDDESVPSLAKRIVLGSIVAVGILLCVVSVLVVQAVVAPEDNVLTSVGIIEKETRPIIITNKQGEFVFAEGCKVGDVYINGMTVEEAKEALKETELAVRPNMNIDVTVDGKSKHYNEDDFTFTYDTDMVLEKLKIFSEEYAKGTTLPTAKDEEGFTYFTDSKAEIKAQLNKSSVEKLIKKINKKYDKAATNAYVSSFDPDAEKMFTFHKGKNGKELDENDLTAQFESIIASGSDDDAYEGSIELNTTPVEPSTDISYLKKNMVMLAEWTTYSTNDASANSNMAVSLAACNGSIIDPGEVWSFNGCTGDSNDPANGYKSAGVIVEGSYTNGYGGGICQSSTTIFNAAVRSNLEIYERNNHTYPSVYAASGFDAAIDYGNLDLKLRNSGNYQVFLSCYMSGATLYAKFYGIKEGNYDYIDTYSENYGVSSTGYHSSSYRIYKDSNGNEIDREQLPDSYYSLEHGHSVAAADSGGQSYPHNQKVST